MSKNVFVSKVLASGSLESVVSGRRCVSAVYKLRANVPDLNLDRHGLALDERLAHERAAGNQKAVAVLVPLEGLLGRGGLLLAHSGSKHERAGAKDEQSARHRVSQKQQKKEGKE